MARCNCGPNTCGCSIQQGTGIDISGDGSALTPYTIGLSGAVDLRGTVQPEGNVVGSPGDIYTSTNVAATQGRTTWQKATGVATNTGWVLIAGDTGWRDISATLINGWAGQLICRRTERIVEFRGSSFDLDVSTNVVVAPVPTGFAVGAGDITNFPLIVAAIDALTNQVWQVSIDNTSISMATFGGDPTDLNWSISGHGTDVWPLVLPGTALV